MTSTGGSDDVTVPHEEEGYCQDRNAVVCFIDCNKVPRCLHEGALLAQRLTKSGK